jgi:pyruvate dehydrogenase E1 component
MALQIPWSSPVGIDDGELAEWRDSVDAVVTVHGPEAAARVLGAAWARARSLGLVVPGMPVSDYVNTLPPGAEPAFPGDEVLEARIRHYVRWNAAVMVARANRRADGIGGHLATYASAATLYEVGFNHFFRGADTGPGDQVYFQGHAAPGIYARAYLEGRLAEADLDGFRREVGGGLPSYPHPRRSDFWQFPTVSMGLGPLMAAYQARFNRYLTDRGGRRRLGLAGVVVRRRRRDGRARVAGGCRHGGQGEAGEPHLRGELQPPSDSMARSGATPKSSKSSRGSSPGRDGTW